MHINSFEGLYLCVMCLLYLPCSDLLFYFYDFRSFLQLATAVEIVIDK